MLLRVPQATATTFCAGEVHLSTDKEKILGFPLHRDKVVNVVCFYVLEGDSFTFIMVEGGANGEAMFDKELGDYWEFEQYLQKLKGEDLNQVQEYLQSIKNPTGFWHRKGYSKIVVFHLTPGKSLIFPTKDLTHGSLILPGNRTMAVLHDLDLCLDSFAQRDRKNTVRVEARIGRSWHS